MDIRFLTAEDADEWSSVGVYVTVSNADKDWPTA